ncbi:MAG: ribosomal protein S18-alanine N-acetyltransferase [Dehalococcoidales bacterium]
MTYSIRPMSKDDLEQVNEIDREAFPSQWPPANYRQELQNKIAHYIVACDDAKTITLSPTAQKSQAGLLHRLMFWTRRRPQADPPVPAVRKYIAGFSGLWMLADEAHVTNLAVRQAYRGKGIGELLLLSSIDLAAELNARYLTLEVRASNLVAQSLYRKYGFVQMGVRRGYYLDNHEDAIIMSTDSISSITFIELTRELREALKKKFE